ncbi:hypothetical protein XELAEV_18029542mg [Xenopus laevis]|uniref:Uncharacterized protein n=1 Tax=Xenopus laevis TaxID=8355 RepID=A0A974CU24_XENLA|nr:hypothetical protein XELAEV_18029542mg [Xenopus laevis]
MIKADITSPPTVLHRNICRFKSSSAHNFSCIPFNSIECGRRLLLWLTRTEFCPTRLLFGVPKKRNTSWTLPPACCSCFLQFTSATKRQTKQKSCTIISHLLSVVAHQES